MPLTVDWDLFFKHLLVYISLICHRTTKALSLLARFLGFFYHAVVSDDKPHQKPRAVLTESFKGLHKALAYDQNADGFDLTIPCTSPERAFSCARYVFLDF